MEEKEIEVVTPEIITSEEGKKLSSVISDFVKSYEGKTENISD